MADEAECAHWSGCEHVTKRYADAAARLEKELSLERARSNIYRGGLESIASAPNREGWNGQGHMAWMLVDTARMALLPDKTWVLPVAPKKNDGGEHNG